MARVVVGAGDRPGMNPKPQHLPYFATEVMLILYKREDSFL